MDFYPFILTNKAYSEFYTHTKSNNRGYPFRWGHTYNKRCILSNQPEITNDYTEVSMMSSTRSLRWSLF